MFTVFGVGGRSPKCENCKNKNAEIGIDGDRDLTKVKLCKQCFLELVEAIDKYVRKVTGRSPTPTTSGT